MDIYDTSLDSLPAEMIIRIGEYLQRGSLAAFIRTAKRYAQLLTPQLLTQWVSCGTGNYCHKLYFHETGHWKSSHILAYFQNFPSDVSRRYCCSTLLYRFGDGGNLDLVKLMLIKGRKFGGKRPVEANSFTCCCESRKPASCSGVGGSRGRYQYQKRVWIYNTEDSSIHGKPEVVRYLLSSGQYTQEALVEAFERGMESYSPDVCEEVWSALEDTGYQLNTTSTKGQIYLHVAAQKALKSLVQFFLDKGHDPFRVDEDGNTALSMACSKVMFRSKNDIETPKLLIQAMQATGRDPFRANKQGISPLHKAIQKSQIDLVRLFLDSGASVTARGKNGIKCVEQVLEGSRELFELLVEREPALWLSRMLESSLQTYAAKVGNGRSSLSILKAIARILRIARSGKITINVSTTNGSNSGSTPLHHICLNYRDAMEIPGIIRSLIATGADVDTPDDEGRTPLYNILRVSETKTERDIIRTMINLSKNINHRSKSGDSYLHLAAQENQLRAVQLLLSKMSKDSMFAVNEFGRTILHCAALSGNTAIIQQILATSIDVNVKDSRGQTALHIIESTDNESCVAVLIEAGADVNILDNQGNPPIHRAAMSGRDGMLELYIKAGASEHEGCGDCNRYFTSTREWLEELGC
ncbi:hypothetical protein AbraIFM66950_004716 [Aspergillus brasiliensis]|nr:hypothetical protein AbraIFM66950_004716 [Aspergillus brasiliensis]